MSEVFVQSLPFFCIVGFLTCINFENVTAVTLSPYRFLMLVFPMICVKKYIVVEETKNQHISIGKKPILKGKVKL